MSVGMWRGVGNVARKTKKRSRGVNNVARTIKKRWRGVDNISRLTYREGLTAQLYQEMAYLTDTSYSVSDNGRTLNWSVNSTNSDEQKVWFRITRDGGFPNTITVSYTTTRDYGATLICGEDLSFITYGNYKNAFCYIGSLDNETLESTYTDDTTHEYLYFTIETKGVGKYTGSVTDLMINGESVEFII